jgi:hypothetical protein
MRECCAQSHNPYDTDHIFAGSPTKTEGFYTNEGKIGSMKDIFRGVPPLKISFIFASLRFILCLIFNAKLITGIDGFHIDI